MIYYAEERTPNRYAVVGRGNDRAAEIDLTENQANSLAHRLAGEEGYVGWKALDGRFERWCSCLPCKKNSPPR